MPCILPLRMQGIKFLIMKRFYFLILLLSPLFATAQEGFINHYTFDRPGVIISDMLLDNDTLILCGLIFPEEPPFIQGIFIAKLDTLGNVLSVKSHFDSLGRHYVLGTFPSGLVKAPDQSGYILLGGVFQSATGMVMKIDNEGEKIWVKEYFDSLSRVDFYKKIIEVPGGYLIGGNKQRLDYSGDIFIKKINHQGEDVWEEWFGTTNNKVDGFGDVFRLNDNEFIIGGSIIPNQNVPWQQTTSKVQIFAIDSLGNEEWRWEGEPSLEEIGLRGLHLNADSNWIYATIRGEFESDGFLKQQPRVIVRNSDFELVRGLDMNGFGGNVESFFYDLVPLSDGGYLGLGSVPVPVDSPIIARLHLRAWMSRMDLDGDTLWERKDLLFPDTLFGTRQILHSAVELSSGSIIAAGYYSANAQQWGMLIKVDRNGCMETINCSPITSVISSSATHAKEIRAYPNPTSSLVQFDTPDIDIWEKIEAVDFSGRVMKVALSTNEIDLGGLTAGVYFVRLWKSDKYQIKKIIKQ